MHMGKNTTKIVTARIISPVIAQVNPAADNAITTIHVAHLSAIPTIFAFLHPPTAPNVSFFE